VIVISPHLDDAVFGCGQFIAAHPGSTLVTVFAGAPKDGAQLTDWDRRCGFASAAEAVQARRLEDACAAGLLGARTLWLDFCDSQYGRTPSRDAIAAVLTTVLRERAPQTVLLPLGLFHSDHPLTHDAAVTALANVPETPWFAYEDALYRGMPGLLQQRLAALAQAGVRATPARLGIAGEGTLKRQAVQAYASQLRAFGEGGFDDVFQHERCWRLEGKSDGD
jgi:LmbE family N-acetylglucosaminyl deacetylase